MHYDQSEVDSKSKYNAQYDLVLQQSERCVQLVGKFSV